MGKSKSSGGSELDPAIRAMMQETFNLGKGTITETVPVLDAQGNQIIDYSSGFPVPRTETRLKEYQEYGDPRFAAPDAYHVHLWNLCDQRVRELHQFRFRNSQIQGQVCGHWYRIYVAVSVVDPRPMVQHRTRHRTCD